MQENSFAANLFSLLNGCSAANLTLLFRFLHAKQLMYCK